jgi:5-methyltetrahydrofolate--homocysteine methyltransferase
VRQGGLDSRSCTPQDRAESRDPEEQRQAALRPRLRPAGAATTRSRRFSTVRGRRRRARADAARELAALPLRAPATAIIDGERNGSRPTSTRRSARAALGAGHINVDCSEGMRVVGELFGSGEMQLPFVPPVGRGDEGRGGRTSSRTSTGRRHGGKGTIVLATVKGDVHDIGKNLVDIILSNNGYTVVNIGIKQPISEILRAAQEHDADVIGMSGLLVKSTVVMKENLEEMNSSGRRHAGR